jgi:lipopolysaccharide transport system ATP-binding protein
MSDCVIRVEHLSKKYEIMAGKTRHDTLRDQISQGLSSLFHRNGHSRAQREDFWALRDVSFEVKPGEVVGIVGRNGAGKSTLLKILSRITVPTAGSAEIRGRVGSLLEVGTGFHPELTGRENIYLNGAILGMKKVEIAHKFDEIVVFSGIEKFLDTPVKRYSSGMYVRLAFAVAAHFEPDILLVDEVLAVGDVAFQKKCLGKIESVANEGRTVLFVSHNLAAIENFCHRGIVIHEGKLLFRGSAKQAVHQYLGIADERDHCHRHVFDLGSARGRAPGFPSILKKLELFTEGNTPLNGSLKIGMPLTAHVHFHLERPTPNVEACLAFDTIFGQRVFTAHSIFEPRRELKVCNGDQTFICEIPSVTFAPGEYRILVALRIGALTGDEVSDAARIDVAETDYYGTGYAPWDGVMVLEQHWRFE